MTARPGPIGAATDRAQPADAGSRVPDLIGLSLEAACELAAWAGITIAVSTTERTVGPRGTVVAQAPSPGARMEPPGHVRVVVSVRPALEPPASPARTPRRVRRWRG